MIVWPITYLMAGMGHHCIAEDRTPRNAHHAKGQERVAR